MNKLPLSYPDLNLPVEATLETEGGKKKKLRGDRLLKIKLEYEVLMVYLGISIL